MRWRPRCSPTPAVMASGGAAVHGEQVFSWKGPLPADQTWSVRGEVRRVRHRRGVWFVEFALEVADDQGRTLVEGSSSFLISGGRPPAGGATAEPEPPPHERARNQSASTAHRPDVGDTVPELFKSASRSDLIRYRGRHQGLESDPLGSPIRRRSGTPGSGGPRPGVRSLDLPGRNPCGRGDSPAAGGPGSASGSHSDPPAPLGSGGERTGEGPVRHASRLAGKDLGDGRDPGGPRLNATHRRPTARGYPCNPMSANPVERDDEHELVARARAGDRQAFSVLAERHQHQVFTLAMRLAGDHDLAADISQEALLRAWRGIGSFRGDARFSSWLYRITVNVTWTTLNRRRRTRHSPLEVVENRPAPPSSFDDPELALESANLRGRLRRALLVLPRRSRVVVVLRDVYGWSHSQIADALDISVSASKVRLHRARKRLRAILERSS